MNPATGMIAIAVALALAVALSVISTAHQIERDRYESRIAELTRASERAEAGFRMELASCQAVGEARQAPATEVAARGSTSEGARRLLEQQPEGIDACARMESADQAVLSNLKKK